MKDDACKVIKIKTLMIKNTFMAAVPLSNK